MPAHWAGAVAADPRTLAALRGPWYKTRDLRAMTVQVVTEHRYVYSGPAGGSAGEWVEDLATLPVRYGVCPLCEGHGRHVNPAIDAGGLSAADLEDNPEFARAYRAGRFDVSCAQCDGRRVGLVGDRDRCSGQKLALVARLVREAEEDAEDERMRAEEARWGA